MKHFDGSILGPTSSMWSGKKGEVNLTLGRGGVVYSIEVTSCLTRRRLLVRRILAGLLLLSLVLHRQLVMHSAIVFLFREALLFEAMLDTCRA